MADPRVSLYDRLPEIYRIKDAEQAPPYLLKNFLGLIEDALGAVHANIETLYHDLFIETCSEWVIPYLADLLGTSHLKGDPWTLRADVADTIALRRRKGTLAAIELLAYNLTRWGCRGVELREVLVWAQSLNHQRPDAGGTPPYGLPAVNRFTPIRGGTVPVRHPGSLDLLNTPFDPFGHFPDLKKADDYQLRYNLPNLAVFLWRLEPYTAWVSRPAADNGVIQAKAPDGSDTRLVRFYVHPLAEPVRLFNARHFDPQLRPPVLTDADDVPGPIHPSRLTTGSPVGHPEAYVRVERYDPADPTLANLDLGPQCLQLHVPQALFADNTPWTFRGANLCAWETGLKLPLKQYEIAIDPIRGRLLISVADDNQANDLLQHLLLTYTYAAVGPSGSHPVSRESVPPATLVVNGHLDPLGLQKALDNLPAAAGPVVIEIQDSLVHDLDLTAVAGIFTTDPGGPSLALKYPLTIRAGDSERPVIRLAQPLRFRPLQVKGSNPDEQKALDAAMDLLTVRLEGLYLTLKSGLPAATPLISRAAVNSLEIMGCTLDPGGYQRPDGAKTALHTAMILGDDYGFDPNTGEGPLFNQTPKIILQRSVSGRLYIDTGYTLALTDTILDAGLGVDQQPAGTADDYALSGPVDPVHAWGPPTQVQGLTVFGRMRAERLGGRGGIWVHSLEVHNNQAGCIKYSYFSAESNRLPEHFACVFGPDADLSFTSEFFGDAAYGQLNPDCDRSILQEGPNEDLMGAFGFLLEAHRWKNLQIRFREFMPVGVRPLLVPVT